MSKNSTEKIEPAPDHKQSLSKETNKNANFLNEKLDNRKYETQKKNYSGSSDPDLDSGGVRAFISKSLPLIPLFRRTILTQKPMSNSDGSSPRITFWILIAFLIPLIIMIYQLIPIGHRQYCDSNSSSYNCRPCPQNAICEKGNMVRS